MEIMDESLHQFERALLSLDKQAARDILDRLPGGGSSLPRIEQLVVAGLERIGELWEKGEAALSQVYMSGRICEELVDSFLPPGDPRRQSQPRIALAVLADHHALGKRIVSSTLRASGFEVRDYGQGLGVGELVERALGDEIEILMISTLMLTSALKVREVVEALRRENRGVKVIVGGAPFLFDDRLWKTVNADAMGHYATDAVRIVESMGGGH